MSNPMAADMHFPRNQRRPTPAGRSPRLSQAGVARVRLIALSLALSVAALAPRAAKAATAPAPSAPPVIAAAEEKRRVPKPPPDQPKSKPDRPGESSGSSGDDDDESGDFLTSCLTDCIGSCLEGLFDSMIEAMFSRKQVAPAHADSLALAAGATDLADTTHADAPYEPHPWSRHDVGFLHTHIPGDSIVLRRGAADPDSLQLEAGRLPDGARVLVTATREGGGGTMLEVRPVDLPGPSGWVHEKSVRQAPPPGLAPLAETTAIQVTAPDTARVAKPAGDSAGAPPAQSRYHLPPVSPRHKAELVRIYDRRAAERWGVVFAVGGAVIDNPELAKEYSAGAVALEAEYLRYLPSSWVVGAGAGYRGFTGKPGVEYVGATEIDVPEHSRFRVSYAVVEFGQRHAWVEGYRFGYAAGPVVGFVHEDATVQVFEGPARAPLGARHEALGRWAAGGGASTWLSVGMPIPLELGIRFRIFGLAWTGQREKSLTSDYTDHGLLHIDGAIILTHAGH